MPLPWLATINVGGAILYILRRLHVWQQRIDCRVNGTLSSQLLAPCRHFLLGSTIVFVSIVTDIHRDNDLVGIVGVAIERQSVNWKNKYRTVTQQVWCRSPANIRSNKNCRRQLDGLNLELIRNWIWSEPRLSSSNGESPDDI